jgi:Asp-tRNA(Asn)/Glu-tRNA(Gln) amidotransferase A subunit family amidase
MPTGYNSPIYENSAPGLIDAAPIITLRAAGALIFGKTTTTEFASTTVGPKSKNPHDPSRTPGGSSSGSGAAVGDFQVCTENPLFHPTSTHIHSLLSNKRILT